MSSTRRGLPLTSSSIEKIFPKLTPAQVSRIAARGHRRSMEGGEAHPLTKISTGADIVKWSPDGKTLAFTSSVYPDCKDDECNKKRNDEKEKNKVKAHVAENLLYRHWTHWNEGPRAHLFVTASDGSGEAKDLTPGANYDVPPDQRGEESDINFSPDSKEICFTAVTDKVEATSTNGDLFIVLLSGGEPKRITTQPGFDGNPVYSPDGKHIAYVKRGLNAWNVDLWMTNPDGSEAHKISDGGGWACWSSDSQWIYFSPPGKNGFQIRKASPDGGPTRLVREQGQKPAVDAEGRLFFVMNLPAVNGLSDMQILMANPEDGSPRQLARISGSRLSNWLLMQPVLSPDGKWLAELLTDGPITNIWAQPTAAGPMRRITDFGHQASFIARRISWSSDGHSVYAAVGKGEADIVLLSNLK